uniref:Uncharacterized protein n=1 Tax=Aquila chrysaetos chrysaetos TaxID=223781 RepID=A0A663E596_AQUCH
GRRAAGKAGHLAWAWGCAGAGSLSPALPGRIPAADGKGSGAEPSKVEQGGEGTRDQGRKRWGQSRERTAVPSSPGPDSIACGAAGVAPARGHGSAGRQVVRRRSPFSPDSAGRTAGSQPWGSPRPPAPQRGGTSRDHRSLAPRAAWGHCL